MYSIYYKKDFAKRFHPSAFVIRYSAVRCLIQAIETAILIIKKPCHFGVVSYKVSVSNISFSSYKTSLILTVFTRQTEGGLSAGLSGFFWFIISNIRSIWLTLSEN